MKKYFLSKKCSRQSFHSTELWLVFRKLKTLSPNEKLCGQQNYFHKMSVFINKYKRKLPKQAFAKVHCWQNNLFN